MTSRSGPGTFLVSLRNAMRDPKQSEKKNELIRKYTETKSKTQKSKLLLKLLAKNLKNRNVTTITALLILPRTVLQIMEEILFHEKTRMAEVKQRKIPRYLQMAGISSVMIEFFEILFKTSYRGTPVGSIVMQNSYDAIRAMALVQVMLAFLQTILEVRYHNKDYVQDRDTLVKLAKSLNVSNTSQMNKDQLRVSIADEMVKRVDAQS